MKRSKVYRYISQYWDERLGKQLFNDTYTWRTSKKDIAVNFYILIELFTFFQLQERGVKTRAILKARNTMIKELNVQYPFATAGMLTNGKKIWYKFGEDIVDADGSKQRNFVDIIESFADRIDFKNNIANRLFPEGRGSSIIIDPHHQFGQPVIKGTNVSAEMLFSMYRSGEPIDTIGILYDLTEKEIKDAIEFYLQAA